MKYGLLFFLVSFVSRLSAQPQKPQDAPLPKGVKSVTTFYCYEVGDDSVEYDQVDQTLYDRKGRETMYIESDTIFYVYDRNGNLTMEIRSAAHYAYDKKGNRTRENRRDTAVYKYDRKGREIERGYIREGIYTQWYTSEYDRHGRLACRLSGGVEKKTFSYAKNGWITTVNHSREEDGYETWITEVKDEKGEVMKYVECYKNNDTAIAERYVYDSVAVRKVGDSIYSEYYRSGFLQGREIANARGTVIRSEWTQDESWQLWITYYDLDSNGHWAGSRTYNTGKGTLIYSTSYTYDAQNRLLNKGGIGGESWTYNKAGQLTEYLQGESRTTYSYNSTGQCIEVKEYYQGRLTRRTVTKIEFYPRPGRR